MPPQTPQLRQISATQGQTIIPLPENQSITIGRDATCQVVLDSTQYQGVSRRHAEIRPIAGGGFEVSDLGSSNGTFVNGQRLQQPRSLRPGDTIQLGRAEVQFVFEAPVSQSPQLGATMIEGQMPPANYPPPATPSYPPATPAYPPATPAYPPAYPQTPPAYPTPPALINPQAPAKSSNNTGKWIGVGIAIALGFAGLNARSLFRSSAPVARQPATEQPTAARPSSPASDQPAPASDQPAPTSERSNSNTKRVEVAALEQSFRLTTEPKEERNRKVTTNSKNFTADILVFEIEAKSDFNPRQAWFGAKFLDANGREVGDPSLLYVENPPAQWTSGDRRGVFLVLPSDRSTLRTVRVIPFTRRN